MNECKYCKPNKVKTMNDTEYEDSVLFKFRFNPHFGFKGVKVGIDDGKLWMFTCVPKDENPDWRIVSTYWDEMTINYCPMCGRKLND